MPKKIEIIHADGMSVAILDTAMRAIMTITDYLRIENRINEFDVSPEWTAEYLHQIPRDTIAVLQRLRGALITHGQTYEVASQDAAVAVAVAFELAMWPDYESPEGGLDQGEDLEPFEEWYMKYRHIIETYGHRR